jgi:hypothetical protein
MCGVGRRRRRRRRRRIYSCVDMAGRGASRV